MQDYENIYIALNPNQREEDLNQSIETLNYLLRSAGAKAEIVKNEEYDSVVLLRVSCKMEDYARIAKRHAGRPEIFNEKMTIGEALDSRETHTMDEIAKMAGISRRTLYRKFKKYKNMRDMIL